MGWFFKCICGVHDVVVDLDYLLPITELDPNLIQKSCIDQFFQKEFDIAQFGIFDTQRFQHTTKINPKIRN